MGLPLPPPSNCKRCHFRRPVELLWLYRFEREAYDEWVELEKAKIAKFAERTAARGQQNCGVFGRKLIPEVLADAVEKYGHMSDDELEVFRHESWALCFQWLLKGAIDLRWALK